MCVNFTDLNKACPKDIYPLLNINKLVDSTASHELFSFMDAFSGYYQIPLAKEYQEKMGFIVNSGPYYYNVMLFGLKKVKPIYQWLINKVFVTFIMKTMEV